MASHKESSLQVVVRTEALCSIVCYGALLLLFAIQTMLAHQLDWRLSVQKLTALHILTTGHWTLDTGHWTPIGSAVGANMARMLFNGTRVVCVA